MAPKTAPGNARQSETPFNAFAELQKAGFGSMMGMSTAWVEAFTDMGAEVVSFLAERISQDVKTRNEILHCKDITELQNIQARFIQKAIEQYQTETGKLVTMSADAFSAGFSGSQKGD